MAREGHFTLLDREGKRRLGVPLGSTYGFVSNWNNQGRLEFFLLDNL